MPCSHSPVRLAWSPARSEEHTSELHSQSNLRARLFFFSGTAPTEIPPLPLHDALPICCSAASSACHSRAMPCSHSPVRLAWSPAGAERPTPPPVAGEGGGGPPRGDRGGR